jgi:CspA family cold shock protein
MRERLLPLRGCDAGVPVDLPLPDTLDGGMENARPVRHSGVVKFFNKEKGFGFIAPEAGGQDVFVHVSAVQRAGLPHLNDGMRLSFATEEDGRGRGPQAVSLQLL